jgi:protein TonB
MQESPVTLLRYPAALLVALLINVVFFLAVPVINVLYFSHQEKSAARKTESLMEVEMVVHEKKRETVQKLIRTISQPNNFKANPVNSNVRSQNFQMDLSLARGALSESGDGVGVAVGGDMGNVVYEAGDVDIEAKSLKEVQPAYPERAKKLGISGYVKVYLVIDIYGNVTQTQILTVDPPGYGFETVSLAAIREWKFEPAKLGGYPVAQKATKEFKFVR